MESAVHTTEQQPVDTDSDDEHRRARIRDTLQIYEENRPRAAASTAESEVRTSEQQPVDRACADEQEKIEMRDALELYRREKAKRAASKSKKRENGC